MFNEACYLVKTTVMRNNNESKMITENDKPSDPTSTDGANIWSIVVALVVMILVSLWFFSYDLPSEKEVGIVDYILFFNKDLVIFPIVLAFLWSFGSFKNSKDEYNTRQCVFYMHP